MVDESGQSYTYAGDDPVNQSDPSGDITCGSLIPIGCGVVTDVQNDVSGFVSQAAQDFGQAVNDALPILHTVSGVVAAVASVCAIVTSETVVGGVTCGTIALAAAAANVATSDALYAEGRESGTTLALDVAGGAAAGAGSTFEIVSVAAKSASDTAQAAADAYGAEAKSASLLGKAIPSVKSSYYGAKAGIWQDVADALSKGSRGAAAVGFGVAGAALGVGSSASATPCG